MSHIFISYCHDDVNYLEQLVLWLNSQGINSTEIWYDHDIEAGKEWRKEITVALEESYAVVVILSKNSANRPYVIFEWAYAMGNGVEVIPAKFDDVSDDVIPDPLVV